MVFVSFMGIQLIHSGFTIKYVVELNCFDVRRRLGIPLLGSRMHSVMGLEQHRTGKTCFLK